MLRGKKILLLTVPMKGYEKELIIALEKFGFEVDCFFKGTKIGKKELNRKERVMRSLEKDFKISFFNKKLKNKRIEIYKKYLKELNEDYDYIFEFGGQTRRECLDAFKEKYKNSKFLMYVWDDLKYTPNAVKILNFFDETYVFNKEEAKKYDLKYRPNFYSDKFIYNNEKKNIDVYYRGAYRENKRLVILKAIDKVLYDLKKDVLLFAGEKQIKKIKKIDFEKYFTLSYEKVNVISEKYKRSKILIDIAYKDQLGLGLRPLEAMAANCKLITTNENIKKYEFYNKNNIFVLNKKLNNLDELKEFIKKDYMELSEETKEFYSIDGFIKSIFEIENN